MAAKSADAPKSPEPPVDDGNYPPLQCPKCSQTHRVRFLLCANCRALVGGWVFCSAWTVSTPGALGVCARATYYESVVVVTAVCNGPCGSIVHISDDALACPSPATMRRPKDKAATDVVIEELLWMLTPGPSKRDVFQSTVTVGTSPASSK